MLTGNADVQNDQHHCLNADAPQNVADGNAQIVMQRGGNRNRDLRQVCGDRQQKQAAQRLAQPKLGRQRIRGIGKENAEVAIQTAAAALPNTRRRSVRDK